LLIFNTSVGNIVAWNEFIDSVGTSISLSGSGVQGNEILYNHITDSGGFGVRVGDGTSKNLIQGNRTYSNTAELVGVTFQSHENRIIGNHAEGTGDNGISLSGYNNTCIDLLYLL
jgi:hypothetical protein